MSSLNKVASYWLSAATAYTTSTPIPGENGTADCDMKKRKVIWTVNNLKGG